MKPDVVDAAKHVDQKQEDYEGDHPGVLGIGSPLYHAQAVERRA
jgi:hypothetical protein